MSNTNITDKYKFRVGDSNHFAVHVVHVQELERKLNSAKTENERLREEIKKAYEEGWLACYSYNTLSEAFSYSIAKQIMEGKE